MSAAETLVRLIVAAVIALPAAGVFAEQRLVKLRRTALHEAAVDLGCVLAVMLALWVAP